MSFKTGIAKSIEAASDAIEPRQGPSLNGFQLFPSPYAFPFPDGICVVCEKECAPNDGIYCVEHRKQAEDIKNDFKAVSK